MTWFAFLTVVIVTVFPWSGCVIIEDSPAPGCVKYMGLSPMGGCFGKSIIHDLKMEPAAQNLRIEINNCNGGVLTVRNLGSQGISLGGVVIAPAKYVVLDVLGREQDGFYKLARVDSNFSRYVPQEDEQISVRGRAGNQDITITYIKTRTLCK